MVKFGPNFCYCAVDQEKPILKGNGPFLAHLPFGARNGKIYCEFLLLCWRPRKGRFLKETAVSGPSAPLGPEMIKFGPNFCYCAVYQEKVVLKRKRTVSSPSALFGPGKPTRPLGGLLEALGLPRAFKDLQRRPGTCRTSVKGFKLPWKIFGRVPSKPWAPRPLTLQRSLREASGRGLRGPLKKRFGGWCGSVQGLGYLILRAT